MTFLDSHGSPLPLDLSQAEEKPEEEYEIERDVLLDMLFGEVRDHVEFSFGTASRAWKNPQTRWPSPSRVEDSVPFPLCSVAMAPTPL
jgi:hypothetical protein